MLKFPGLKKLSITDKKRHLSKKNHKKLLAFQKSGEAKNILENIYIAYRVFRTGGLTRFLVFEYNKKSSSRNVFHGAENLSRSKLALNVFLNWDLFVVEILGNLHLKKLNEINFEKVNIIDRPMYQLALNQSQLTQNFYIIEDLYFTKLAFKYSLSKFNIPIITSILDRVGFRILNKINYFGNDLTIDERLLLMKSPRPDYLEKVEIWHQRFIVKNDDWIMIDVSTDPSNKFVAGNWPFTHELKSVDCAAIRVASKEHVYVEKGIFLIGRCDENWFHFLIDTLPRLLVLDLVPKNIPIIVRDDLPDHFYLYLKHLSKRKVIKISNRVRVLVDKLYFLSARSAVFDSTIKGRHARLKYSPIILNELARKLCDFKSSEVGSIPQNGLFAFERISRYRNLMNWNELLPVMIKKGFTIIDSKQNWFESQISIFKNTKVVIAPGGAIFANMIFMKPGSIVIPLVAGNSIDSLLWKNLAAAFNLRCFPIGGSSKKFVRIFEDIHSDFYINPNIVDKTLEDLMVSIT